MKDISALINRLHNQRLIKDYAFVYPVALMVYDYALTLHLEIKFIWLSPWTYTKVLFLLIRYIAFADASLYIVNRVFLDVSAEFCRVSWPVVTCFTVLRTFLTHVVLSIRTWAVWRRNKAVGILLVTLTLLHAIAACVITVIFLKSMKFGTPPFPGYRGCFATNIPTIVWANFAVSTPLDAVVLTLMIISASQSYQLGSIGELSHVIYRDGVLFYLYLLCLPIANVITTLVLPTSLMPLFLPLQDMLYSTFTTRVILNMREANHRGLETELHTSHCDDCLVFATPDLQLTRHEHQDNVSQPQPEQESRGGDANDMHAGV